MKRVVPLTWPSVRLFLFSLCVVPLATMPPIASGMWVLLAGALSVILAWAGLASRRAEALRPAPVPARVRPRRDRPVSCPMALYRRCFQ